MQSTRLRRRPALPVRPPTTRHPAGSHRTRDRPVRRGPANGSPRCTTSPSCTPAPRPLGGRRVPPSDAVRPRTRARMRRRAAPDGVAGGTRRTVTAGRARSGHGPPRTRRPGPTGPSRRRRAGRPPPMGNRWRWGRRRTGRPLGTGDREMPPRRKPPAVPSAGTTCRGPTRPRRRPASVARRVAARPATLRPPPRLGRRHSHGWSRPVATSIPRPGPRCPPAGPGAPPGREVRRGDPPRPSTNPSAPSLTRTTRHEPGLNPPPGDSLPTPVPTRSTRARPTDRVGQPTGRRSVADATLHRRPPTRRPRSGTPAALSMPTRAPAGPARRTGTGDGVAPAPVAPPPSRSQTPMPRSADVGSVPVGRRRDRPGHR